MVELPVLGRRGTLSIFTREDPFHTSLLFPLRLTKTFSCCLFTWIPVLTGAFILASTTARTSDALLGWNCAYSFTSNIMYGVLYAITPELFPTKDRGTGNALTATANRIFGVMVRFVCFPLLLITQSP